MCKWYETLPLSNKESCSNSAFLEMDLEKLSMASVGSRCCCFFHCRTIFCVGAVLGPALFLAAQDGRGSSILAPTLREVDEGEVSRVAQGCAANTVAEQGSEFKSLQIKFSLVAAAPVVSKL